MKLFLRYMVVFLMLGQYCATNAGAWDREEHRLLADSVYHSVMRECAHRLSDTAYCFGDGDDRLVLSNRGWGQQTFAALCSESSDNDLARNRFHRRGKTILEQLRTLARSYIEESWRIVNQWAYATNLDADTLPSLPSLPPVDNVVAAYLCYHLMALHFLEIHTDSVQLQAEYLRCALVIEAAAQGYLADAFSAGHILTPRHAPLAGLQRRNIIEAHDFHRNEGVYVVNGRGEAWHTFGDGLLHWYAPTYRAVLKAGRASLRQVLAVYLLKSNQEMPDSLRTWFESVSPGQSPAEVVDTWLIGRTGPEYYTRMKLPSLMYIPMPVAATWSLRTVDRDEHGIRRHRHFPQLRDDGYHDPELIEADPRFLYRRSAVPDWKVPESLDTTNPRASIRENPDLSSVLWTQTRYRRPSFKGLLISLGGHVTSCRSDNELGGLFGLGYGFGDDWVILRNVSLETNVLTAVGKTDRVMLATTVGAGAPWGPGPIKTFRLDGGAVVDLRNHYGEVGGLIAPGVDLEALSLPFSYAGLTLRLKYQLLILKGTRHGLSIQFILH